MYDLGKRLKHYREIAGLSQKEFAEKINIKNTTISNWEQGVSRPNADILSDICKALNVSPDELLDINISNTEFTEHERRVLRAYRNNPQVQHAIDILLGL